MIKISRALQILLLPVLFIHYANSLVKAQANFHVEQTNLVFPEICSGMKASLVIPFKNIGQNILRIDRIQAGNEGVNVSLAKTLYSEGETGEILIEFHPQRKGRFYSALVVESNGLNPLAQLRLSGEVIECADSQQTDYQRLQNDNMSLDKNSSEIYFTKSNHPNPNRVSIIVDKSSSCTTAIGNLNGSILQNQLLGIYDFVEREKIDLLLDEMKLGLSGVQDESSMVQFGRTLGAEGLIILAIECDNNDIQSIQARLIDCESSKLVWSSVGVNCTSMSDFAQRIRMGLEGQQH